MSKRKSTLSVEEVLDQLGFDPDGVPKNFTHAVSQSSSLIETMPVPYEKSLSCLYDERLSFKEQISSKQFTSSSETVPVPDEKPTVLHPVEQEYFSEQSSCEQFTLSSEAVPTSDEKPPPPPPVEREYFSEQPTISDSQFSLSQFLFPDEADEFSGDQILDDIAGRIDHAFVELVQQNQRFAEVVPSSTANVNYNEVEMNRTATNEIENVDFTIGSNDTLSDTANDTDDTINTTAVIDCILSEEDVSVAEGKTEESGTANHERSDEVIVLAVIQNILDQVEGIANQIRKDDVHCVIKCLLLQVAKIIKPKTSFRSEHDIITKNILKHPVLTRCCHTGLTFCKELDISDEFRDTINREYWYKSFEGRRQWLDSNIHIVDVAKKSEERTKNRNISLTYHLPTENGGKHRVCQELFLSTLGLKCDSTIQEFLKAKQCGNVVGAISAISEGKGKYVRTNKFEKDIRRHINSYHPYVSHYRLKNSPHRRYLDSDLCMMDLYKDYKKKFGKSASGVETYRKIFIEENIGFSQPSADDCEDCLEYKVHIKEVSHKNEVELRQCKICSEFALHHESYTAARKEYHKEENRRNDGSLAVYTADMMKVFLLPKLSTKEHHFVSRLVVFNETFARMNVQPEEENQEHLVILWHEALSGRTAQDVASTYLKCMKVAGAEKYLSWVGNCGGQNKNWYLFTIFVNVVNNYSEWNVSEITMKYLHKGHTYMLADSLHGSFADKICN